MTAQPAEKNLPARFVFTGRVHPERAQVSINLPGRKCTIIDKGCGISGEMSTDISCSQICVIYSSETGVVDILTLKNAVEDAIRLQLDILGYVLGCGYDAEITQAIALDTHEKHVFGVGIPVIEQRKNQNFEQILNLFNVDESDYLRRCLADLREAVKTPKDTGEFCYRAIETLRKFFAQQNGLDDNKRDECNKSWEILRNELVVERKELDEIAVFAVDIRHGGTMLITSDNRARIFGLTWDIVDKFIAYAKNGYKRK